MQLMPLPQRKLQCGRFTLDLSQPQIMGILNVTPDSFSDGGLHHQKDQAIQHALRVGVVLIWGIVGDLVPRMGAGRGF